MFKLYVEAFRMNSHLEKNIFLPQRLKLTAVKVTQRGNKTENKKKRDVFNTYITNVGSFFFF